MVWCGVVWPLSTTYLESLFGSVLWSLGEVVSLTFWLLVWDIGSLTYGVELSMSERGWDGHHH